ncbi:hypothetical protein LOK74_17740 [Brevibacillus humidisoli]|uniref:hypothetical protein n=1 Tax=Brevibacillus humidisoli TaxID=2895522 RepID=UPI001E5C634A|nr:hypothetical protein [Brevibacillus humidisoli]UFJ39876.1 hypothetical protein LOK74_17740 [Brevibacillus humidisoli]
MLADKASVQAESSSFPEGATFTSQPCGAGPKRGLSGATLKHLVAIPLLRPPASDWRSGQSRFLAGWQPSDWR